MQILEVPKLSNNKHNSYVHILLIYDLFTINSYRKNIFFYGS
jgi:hypothetical protein